MNFMKGESEMIRLFLFLFELFLILFLCVLKTMYLSNIRFNVFHINNAIIGIVDDYIYQLQY